MIIKTTETGDRIASRPENNPEVRDVTIPLSALAGTKYLSAERLGQIAQAVRDYYLFNATTVPADSADAVMPTFGAIVDATEAAAHHRHKISKTRSDAAKYGRKKQMADCPRIEIPEIIVPVELNLAPIIRAEVTIQPQEYLSVIALFLIRGFKVGEQRSFYGYYAHMRWNHGTIDGIEARMVTAQLWNQRTGDKRFRQDPAAYELMRSLLNLLPADKRAFLLADGVRVEIDEQMRVVMYAPKPIHDDIMNNSACLESVKRYAASHGLESVNLGLNPISFSIEMNNR